MQFHLSSRIRRIDPSPTMALSARTTELKNAGKDIINLTVGEPDFNTPDHIKAAAIQAIHDNQTKYTPSDGTPSLKKAIQTKFKRDHNLDYSLEQIIVSCGAKHVLYNLFQALLNHGEEVILFTPYWVSYPAIVKLAGGKPVLLKAGIDQCYKVTPDQLKNAITNKTRAVIINSPCNPTGSIYSKDELVQFAKILANTPEILIVSDDIYESITLTSIPSCNILDVWPDLYNHTILVNGVSKTYAMTGWRIGYAAGPAKLIEAMRKLQSQSTSNPCSIAQAASEAALLSDQNCIQIMIDAFKERHQFMLNSLQTIEGVKVIPSEGTFYMFPNVKDLIKHLPNVRNDMQLAEWFLNEANVALVPGTAFGCPNSVRISFATRLDTLQEAIKRIRALLGRH